MPDAGKLTDGVNTLIVNAGVVGAIAIILIIGFGWIIYSIGNKIVDLATKFVTGTLQFQETLVQRFDEQSEKHTAAFSEMTKAQTEMQHNQSKLADRLDLALRNRP